MSGIVPMLALLGALQLSEISWPEFIYFDADKAELTEVAQKKLARVAVAQKQTGEPLTVTGHTDRHGSDAENVRLSTQRANAVRSYLVSQGIPAAVIRTEAFGEARPLVETADGAREPDNNRVEIVLGSGSGW